MSNLSEALDNYIKKQLNESIALGKPFSKITKKDILNYVTKIGWEDGQLKFGNGWYCNDSLKEPHLLTSSTPEKKNIGICWDFIRNLTFPLSVYRGLKLNSVDELDLKVNIGPHWTTNPRLMLSRDSGLNCCNDEEDLTHVIIGKIANQDDIDLGKTIVLFFDNYAEWWGENEYEVYIPHPESAVQILGVVELSEFANRLRNGKIK